MTARLAPRDLIKRRDEEMAREEFRGYVLEVGGLVEQPLRLSLQELRAMPKQTQVTKHCCIQGWSAIAEWSGIPRSHIIGLCRPLASARFAVLYVRRIDFVDDYLEIGEGQGGWREDHQYYSQEAGI